MTDTTSSPLIVVDKLDKWFGDHHVLKDINLAVARGEVVVVIGPSGSGKSTLCRCINRLERFQKGSITIDGATLPEEGKELAALRADTLEEIRLYDLRHGEAISQVELAGRLDVTQGAISKLEHSEDVRVSTLRQYLEALGARLELVAVFDDDARRVPVHLGKGSAA